MTAATYRPCSEVTGFFAQGFAFTDGRIRGCVPLEVRVGDQARVQPRDALAVRGLLRGVTAKSQARSVLNVRDLRQDLGAEEPDVV